MSFDYQSHNFKKLLDKLQQESWQLELLISGFAIFGLITAFPEIGTAMSIAENDDQYITFSFLLIAIVACGILTFNLLIHVILRGLWIGALGLRYVSGDIDFESLNYHNKFTKYLKRKIVSFDKYVANLENYCSVVFAISFLLIFYVISIFIICLAFVGNAMYIISNDALPETPRTIIGVIILFFIVFGILFTFIDFVTQGFLKKKKWLAKIYFPFYWVFSYLTLTFLYRPLVYNFLDNKFTRKISFFLVPSYIAILFLISLKYNNSNYLSKSRLSNDKYVNNRYYENYLTSEDDFPNRATIQSKVITDPYLKIFKVFSESTENDVFRFHPSLKPENDRRGFTSDIIIYESTETERKRDSLTRKYLEVFNLMHEIYIDDTNVDENFLVTKNKKDQLGFETYVKISHLEEGRHTLRIKKLVKRNKQKDTIRVNDVSIPFWYYKQ